MPAILDENGEKLNKTRAQLVPVVGEWLRAYWECTPEVQTVVRDMFDILSSADAEDDDKEMAAATLLEALFPSNRKGSFGADLEELEEESKKHFQDYASAIHELDQEEASFADRVETLMQSKGMTQEGLAKASGVGQSAISMMLARNARPQKRTVMRIAQALEVPAEDLWPSIEAKP